MLLLRNQTAYLSNPDGRELGKVRIDRIEGDLVLGAFTPGADFDAVRPVFVAFEEAVERQVLSEVDRLDREIAAIQLCVRNGTEGAEAVRDVQIYRDGGVSFRLSAVAERNGVHHA